MKLFKNFFNLLKITFIKFYLFIFSNIYYEFTILINNKLNIIESKINKN